MKGDTGDVGRPMWVILGVEGEKRGEKGEKVHGIKRLF